MRVPGDPFHVDRTGGLGRRCGPLPKSNGRVQWKSSFEEFGGRVQGAVIRKR